MNIATPVVRPTLPDHVDPARVRDYDVFKGYKPDEVDSLHDGLLRLADDHGRGIFWTESNGGHWFINDRELLFQAVRDPGLFSSTAMTIPPLPRDLEPRMIPLMLDPPTHGAFRMPLMKAFAPQEIKRLEASIRTLAIELIDAVAPKGQCEFLEELAEPLPVTVFMKMMGIPLDRLPKYRATMFDMMSDDEERRLRSFVVFGEDMGQLVIERMAKREDDLISRLIDADIEGRPPSFDELVNYCVLLLTAGLDTLVNAFSFGVTHLAQDPELQLRLKADKTLIGPFMEEVLRRYGGVMPPRMVMYDTDFGGVQLKAGDRVLMMLPAGNLDPQSTPDYKRFDIDREEVPHLTFNSGPHRCAGSHLARLEMRIFFEEWFDRVPVIRLDPASPPVYRAGINLAMWKLPVPPCFSLLKQSNYAWPCWKIASSSWSDSGSTNWHPASKSFDHITRARTVSMFGSFSVIIDDGGRSQYTSSRAPRLVMSTTRHNARSGMPWVP